MTKIPIRFEGEPMSEQPSLEQKYEWICEELAETQKRLDRAKADTSLWRAIAYEREADLVTLCTLVARLKMVLARRWMAALEGVSGGAAGLWREFAFALVQSYPSMAQEIRVLRAEMKRRSA